VSDTAQQVLITRVFDAPRELVFAAWTDPDQVAVWFGPEGVNVVPGSVVIDLRVGGRYELTMGQFELKYEIVELEPPRLLVLRSDPIPEVGIHDGTITRVELHDHGDRTRMTLSDGPYTEATHAEAGWHAAFGKLEAMLGR
jgi:uncharacterized protein YndB with AHSA1/START domain